MGSTPEERAGRFRCDHLIPDAEATYLRAIDVARAAMRIFELASGPHARACKIAFMRTTIELKPEHRAKLLEIAAYKGEKGFSSVIADAIESYLKTGSGANKLKTKALSARGKLKPRDAALLRRRVGEIRNFWR